MPILGEDLSVVGAFLHSHLNERLSAARWAAATEVPWQVEAPNHGFRLLADGTLVGVYLAFYSCRSIAGRLEKFCNLGAWCVLPSYRLHSLLLLRALLAQKGYHFTDLSPSGNTVPVNERLKFTRLDSRTALMPNVPWPFLAGIGRIVDDPIEIEELLDEHELSIYRDHKRAGAVRQLVVVDRSEHCLVMFRRDRRKKLPLFASVLYASNPHVFQREAGRIARYLLCRHGVLATLVELRVAGGKPGYSFLLKSPRPKMFRSDTLRPEQIDNLYSELVCVAW